MVTQTQQVSKEAEVVESKEMFQAGLESTKIERIVRKYLVNNEMSKERKDENGMLKLDIASLMGESLEPLVYELPNGMFAVVKQKHTEKESLDKDILAELSGIEKEEFKHPLDYAMLLTQGKITTEMIKRSVVMSKSVTVSIKEVKNNPNDKKKKRKFS